MAVTHEYQPKPPPDPATRAKRGDKRMMMTHSRRIVIIAQTIKDHARALGRGAIGLAPNWIVANPIVSSVVIGPKPLAQLPTYLPTRASTVKTKGCSAAALPHTLIRSSR